MTEYSMLFPKGKLAKSIEKLKKRLEKVEKLLKKISRITGIKGDK